MTERARRWRDIADALMSEASVDAGPVMEPKRDMRAVVEGMGPSWLSVTGCEFARRCQEMGLAQARLQDLFWGLVVGYQIANREVSADAMKGLFELEEKGGR